MGYYVDEIKTISQYAVINFKDADGLIFKSVRCMINESVDLPVIMTNMTGILDPITFDKEYTFTGGWKDINDEVVTQVVATGPYDYFADVYNLRMYYIAIMETDPDGTQRMMANYPFKIYSNKKIYLSDSEDSPKVKPTVTHSYDNNTNDIVNDVRFTIDDLSDNSGGVTSFETQFKVYKKSALIKDNEIGTIKFEIRIYHSSEQPTGD